MERNQDIIDVENPTEPGQDLEMALSPKVWVKFERAVTKGLLSKVWVDDRVLNFVNGKARRMLAPGKHYVIEWFMEGNVGDTLSITRTARGQEKKVVDKSEITSGSRHCDFTVDKF